MGRFYRDDVFFHRIDRGMCGIDGLFGQNLPLSAFVFVDPGADQPYSPSAWNFHGAL